MTDCLTKIDSGTHGDAPALSVLELPSAGTGDAIIALFSYQHSFFLPSTAHSFAVFLPPRPCRPSRPAGKSVTISWLPSSRQVRTFWPWSEKGSNLNLPTTLTLARSLGVQVNLWGPYRVAPELYALALQQDEHLQSGEVRYKAIDWGYCGARVTNCIHAISDIFTGTPYRRYALSWWGKLEGEAMAASLCPWLLGVTDADLDPVKLNMMAVDQTFRDSPNCADQDDEQFLRRLLGQLNASQSTAVP